MGRSWYCAGNAARRRGTMAKRNGKPKDITTLADVRPQQRNANKHTQRGMGLLGAAMREVGYVAPMTVAADGEAFDGSARLETVVDVFGVDVEPIIVHSDGTRPIIHVRDDIPTATDPRAVRAALAANQIAAANLEWDAGVIAAINAEDDAVFAGLFEHDELADIMAQAPDVEFKEYDETIADGLSVCRCEKCGHEHAAKAK